MAAAVVVASLAIVAWAYVGYPALCWLRARLAPSRIVRRPVAADDTVDAVAPRVSVVIAAWRERDVIAAKLASLAAQRYPASRLEVIVACDGSDDGTDAIARAEGTPLLGDRLTVLALPSRHGKPAALDAAVARARGEILVFSDARQPLAPDAIAELVADLADPRVGVVGGRLVLEGAGAEGAYWRYETAVRAWEGRHGSTVGVSGALYAMRRALWRPLPAETILDDVLVPARARLDGWRVAYEPAALAFDHAAPTARELRRKARTLAGNLQLCLLEPALLDPRRNPDWLDFLSHKLARIAVPFALALALVASSRLRAPWGPSLLATQLLPYPLAALRALGLRARLPSLCHSFVVLNAAAVVGVARFVRYGRYQPW